MVDAAACAVDLTMKASEGSSSLEQPTAAAQASPRLNMKGRDGDEWEAMTRVTVLMGWRCVDEVVSDGGSCRPATHCA